MKIPLIQRALNFLNDGCFIAAESDGRELVRGTVFIWDAAVWSYETEIVDWLGDGGFTFGSGTMRRLEHPVHDEERSVVKILVKFPGKDPLWIFAQETNELGLQYEIVSMQYIRDPFAKVI